MAAAPTPPSPSRRRPGLLVVRHHTRGRAAAINRGVQEATAPIICVLHADTLLPDDAVAVMRRVLAPGVPATTLPARPAAAIRRPRHVLPPRRFPGCRWLRPHAAGHGGGGFVHPLPPARPDPPRPPRGDHLRSPGRRLGRAAGELDLPQGRSTLGARLSAKGWSGITPRCAEPFARAD